MDANIQVIHPTLPKGFTLVVTGHRPNKLDWTRITDGKNVVVSGYDYKTLASLVKIANKHIAELKPARVIAGAAQGWDTACAIAALQLNIPLTIVVAFPSVSERWVQDKCYQAWLKTLTLADEVVVLRPGAPKESEEHLLWLKRHENKVPQENEAARWLQNRNEYMIDRAHKVLALWNGIPRGGTSNALKYAAKMGLSMRNAWGDWIKLIASGEL